MDSDLPSSVSETQYSHNLNHRSLGKTPHTLPPTRRHTALQNYHTRREVTRSPVPGPLVHPDLFSQSEPKLREKRNQSRLYTLVGEYRMIPKTSLPRNMSSGKGVAKQELLINLEDKRVDYGRGTSLLPFDKWQGSTRRSRRLSLSVRVVLWPNPVSIL